MNGKYSKQKETLLKVLCSTECHPDADWIYEQVRQEIPNISLGTVYRNLAKMSQDGTILKLNVNDGRDHFDGNTLPHHHMVCRECGAVIDIFMDESEEKSFSEYVNSYAEKHTAATVEAHTVIFFGKCQNCNKI
ncbi:MAG: transcriptional repressor [Ruminococcaceae bacterium]|nr:transcriptional repressor [Oscillospiraceae bacterium]